MKRLLLCVTVAAAVCGGWRWFGQHSNTQVHRVNQ
jgi:hypothetical protein